MVPQRLLRFVIAGAAILALPAVLAAAPPNISGARHVGTRSLAPARQASAPAERVTPSFVGVGNRNLPAIPLRAAPVSVPQATSRAGSGATTGSTLSRGPAAPATLSPLGMKPAVSAPSILYAPSDVDDPAFRAAVAAITGGVVDYFDARVATPTAVQLAAYSSVYTLANFPYFNSVLFGDRLADYVDAGGKVILGVFCTYTSGNSLGGRIMTAPYSPVTSPGGTNHFAVSAYAGDGIHSMHAGVLAYDAIYRDVLVLQGAGIVNGTYADGEIAQAYRPDGRVIYSNGTGAAPLAGTGDWAKIIANAASAHPNADGMLTAPSDFDDPSYRLSISSFTSGVVDYFDANAATPSAALLATYDCIATWVDFTYNDNVTFGDRLADRVDAGGTVILGPFCTFNSTVYFLSGRIMTPDYSPVVSPTGTNHYTLSSYAGDGTSGLYGGVAALGSFYRDVLIGQGSGIVDGHYADGEVAAAYRPDGHVVYLNGVGTATFGGTGDWARAYANACTSTLTSSHRILYAPAEPDNPTYRAQMAAQSGAAVVDYFDARTGTPSAALLATYNCVYTWPDYPYSDRVLFGDRLADFADAGGTVVLGSFCTYTSGSSLGGRIMTAPYCPVISPGGTNHFTVSAYNNDGATCFHHGVSAYDTFVRDFLVLQGAGITEATYADGEIAFAYRPDRRVVYMNGVGSLYGTGDWGRLIANGCECGNPPGVLFASNNSGQLFVLNTLTGAASYDLNLPTFGGIGATEIEFLGAGGGAWVQGRDGTFSGQKCDLYTGAPLGAVLGTGGSFNGLEFALGKLYGTSITGGCGASTFSVLDPTTGVSAPIGPTGLAPISGLAFDKRWSVLYGVTGGCSGPSNLVRIDVTSGVATVIGPTISRYGSLEFGPEGDLYAGGDNADGGNLYRINPLNGFTRLVGVTGMGGVTGITLGSNGPVAVGDGGPASLAFASPFPNPSQQGTVQFRFSVPTQGNARLELYDVAGRLLWRKAMPGLEPGSHTVTWDGRASSGQRLGAGVYQMRLISPAGTRAVRIVRID